MLSTTVTIHPDFTVGNVPRRLFGSFVEHMGRGVYGGIFEPGHPRSDENGVRLDVAALVKELGVSVVRYPGGNFVSGYQWEDGVGPARDRPSRLDLAWRAVESNQFGTNEFLRWCRLTGVEPMMAVNLGTRGIADACNLLEYSNHPSGTYYSDLRASHGYREPHDIKLWCLGNEMDGPWQLGHKTAEEYGRLAAETARAMRLVDPTIELVACGSSNAQMPTFGSWEATVLDHAYDDVDYISMHAYYELGTGDLGTYLASGFAMDRFIDAVVATVDHVGAKKRSRRRVNVSFDEWNIWSESTYERQEVNWDQAPHLIEETYSVKDAVVFGTLLMSLLRHADRVTVACLAQLVNVIAPIRAEASSRAWQQTIFHPFALMARYARGEVLRVEQSGPLYATDYGDVPLLDVIATTDGPDEVTIFAASRAQDENIQVEVDLRPFPALSLAEYQVIGGSALDDANTEMQPRQVVPREGAGARVTEGRLWLSLPPVSWSVVRLVPVQAAVSFGPAASLTGEENLAIAHPAKHQARRESPRGSRPGSVPCS